MVRSTEGEETIKLRCTNALGEIEKAKDSGVFDYVLKNDTLDRCYNELKDIALKECGI